VGTDGVDVEDDDAVGDLHRRVKRAVEEGIQKCLERQRCDDGRYISLFQWVANVRLGISQ
jgi:hypothetical protein